MLQQRNIKANNLVSLERGQWGEEMAARYLTRKGYRILERNVKPVKKDQRLEIDLICYSQHFNTIVFVEVKQHAYRSEYQRRLRSINKNKRKNLYRACKVWLLKKKWLGSYRFDVIEVYGTPENAELVEIDHIERVNLFVQKSKFINWSD